MGGRQHQKAQRRRRSSGDDTQGAGRLMTAQDPELTRAEWDRIAAGYDQFVTPTEVRLANEALAFAGVRPGTRFLDVAAGTGGLGLPAARLGAEVLATDLSPRMIERLLARAREAGLDNVEARVMDGHALELEDDAFDVSGSQFGVMLFPDLPHALEEMVRVTKPGGRVLLIVYGPPTQVEFLGFFLGAARAVLPGFEGLPADPPPLEFQVSDPEKLRGMLRERSGGNGRAVLTNPVHIGIGTKSPEL